MLTWIMNRAYGDLIVTRGVLSIVALKSLYALKHDWFSASVAFSPQVGGVANCCIQSSGACVVFKK